MSICNSYTRVVGCAISSVGGKVERNNPPSLRSSKRLSSFPLRFAYILAADICARQLGLNPSRLAKPASQSFEFRLEPFSPSPSGRSFLLAHSSRLLPPPRSSTMSRDRLREARVSFSLPLHVASSTFVESLARFEHEASRPHHKQF